MLPDPNRTFAEGNTDGAEKGIQSNTWDIPLKRTGKNRDPHDERFVPLMNKFFMWLGTQFIL